MELRKEIEKIKFQSISYNGETKPITALKNGEVIRFETNKIPKNEEEPPMIDKDMYYESVKIPKRIKKVFQKKTLKRIKNIFREADLKLSELEKELNSYYKKIKMKREEDVFYRVIGYLRENIDNVKKNNFDGMQDKIDSMSMEEFNDKTIPSLLQFHIIFSQEIINHMKDTERKFASFIFECSKEDKATKRGLCEILTAMKVLREKIRVTDGFNEGDAKNAMDFEKILLLNKLRKNEEKLGKCQETGEKGNIGKIEHIDFLEGLEKEEVKVKEGKEIEIKENINEIQDIDEEKINIIQEKENRIEEKENRIEEKENRIEEKKSFGEIEILKEKKEIQIKVENNHPGSKNINDFNSLDLRVSILEDTLPASLLSEYGCFVVGVDENNYLISKYREGLIFYLEGKMAKKYTIGSKYI